MEKNIIDLDLMDKEIREMMGCHHSLVHNPFVWEDKAEEEESETE